MNPMFAEYGHENKRREIKLLSVTVHSINNNAGQKIKSTKQARQGQMYSAKNRASEHSDGAALVMSLSYSWVGEATRVIFILDSITTNKEELASESNGDA